MGTPEGNEQYGWSKYSGGWYGYASHNKIHDEWTCQACGTTQPEDLKPFMFLHSHREYVRICAVCLHTAKRKKVKQYSVLIKIVRKTKLF